MALWTVSGTFLARRGFWQPFHKQLDAPDAGSAREIALSQIGGNHQVPRRRIRIESVTEAKA